MRPIVLLHGFAGTASTFDGLRAALGDDGVHHAPLLYGHGASATIACYEDEVDRVAGLLPKTPIVVGYSFGGRLALGLVARHPERVAAAVVIGAHPGLADETERAERRAADARWSAVLRRDGLDAFVAAWEAQPLFASQAALPAPTRAAQRAARARLDAAALADAMDRLGLGAMPCWTPALQRATTPMTFVAGALDPKYVALGESLARTIPAMRFVCAPRAGHNVVLERPDVVATVVREMAAR